MPIGTVTSAYLTDNIWQKKQGKQAGNWFQDHIYDLEVDGSGKYHVRTSRRQGTPTFAIGEIISFEWSTDRNTGEFKSFLKDDGVRRYDVWKCSHQSGPTNAGQAYGAPTPDGFSPNAGGAPGFNAGGAPGANAGQAVVMHQHEHVQDLIKATLDMTKHYYDELKKMMEAGDLPGDITNETLVQIASHGARQHHIDCSYSRYSVTDVLNAIHGVPDMPAAADDAAPPDAAAQANPAPGAPAPGAPAPGAPAPGAPAPGAPAPGSPPQVPASNITDNEIPF